MFGRRFKPRLWATVAAVVGVAAGIVLGQWQLGRAQQKLKLAEVMAQRASEPAVHIGSSPLALPGIEHRIVEARGRYDPGGMVLLDNRVRGGVVGYEVVMPLRLEGSDVHLLVNRGWIRGTGDRRRLPQVHTPSTEVAITGIAIIPGRNVYELSADAVEGPVWQNLMIDRYREKMPYRIHPILVRQTNDAGDGLVRDWVMSERAINVHRSYALQWFSLSALVALVYFFLSLRRVSQSD